MQNMDIMPKGVMQPSVKPFDIDIDIPIVTVAFYPKTKSNINDVRLFEMVRKVQQKINAVENVAKTTLKGERKAQYNIEVDMGKLSAYHLSLGQIMQAVQSLAVSVPDVKGRSHNNHLVIFGVKNAIESVEDVRNVIVAQYMGSPIYLKDVANVTDGVDIQNFQTAKILMREETKNQDAEDDGLVHTKSTLSEKKNQITMTVAKLAGTNAVFVAEDVLDLLKGFEHEFEKLGVGYLVTRNYGV
jgi:multidrug efflux pump subunit AcrB